MNGFEDQGVLLVGEAPALVSHLTALGAGVTTLAASDLAEEAEVERAFAAAGDLTGLVTVLPRADDLTLDALTADALDLALRLTLRTSCLCAREAARGMLARGRGAIVHVVPHAALRGSAAGLVASTAAGGLVALTRVMAVELAPDGVHAHLVVADPGAASLGPVVAPLLSRSVDLGVEIVVAR